MQGHVYDTEYEVSTVAEEGLIAEERGAWVPKDERM